VFCDESYKRLNQTNESVFTESYEEENKHFQILEIFIFIWILTLLLKELNLVSLKIFYLNLSIITRILILFNLNLLQSSSIILLQCK
jgi:hypothetical protein